MVSSPLMDVAASFSALSPGTCQQINQVLRPIEGKTGPIPITLQRSLIFPSVYITHIYYEVLPKNQLSRQLISFIIHMKISKPWNNKALNLRRSNHSVHRFLKISLILKMDVYVTVDVQGLSYCRLTMKSCHGQSKCESDTPHGLYQQTWPGPVFIVWTFRYRKSGSEFICLSKSWS